MSLLKWLCYSKSIQAARAAARQVLCCNDFVL